MQSLKSIVAGIVALGSLSMVAAPAEALTVYSPAPAAVSVGVAAEPVVYCHFGRCRGGYVRRAYGYRRPYGYRRGVCHNGRCRGY